MKKRFLVPLTVLLTLLVCLALQSVLASNGQTKKTIEVLAGGIDIYVDGALQTPKDANGNVVQPIVWNGTTYLPVRALTNMLTDKEVTWDGATSSIYLGAKPAASVQTGLRGNTYTSTKNPSLAATVGSAVVSINGEIYRVENFSFGTRPKDGALSYLSLEDLAGKYTVHAAFTDLPDLQPSAGDTMDLMTGSTSRYVSLTGFYSNEKNDSGLGVVLQDTISTSSSYSSILFNQADLTVERYDPAGVCAVYFHIKTTGTTSGKTYDIQILAVADQSASGSSSTPTSSSTSSGSSSTTVFDTDLCVICLGTGKCMTCSGKGTGQYYNALTNSMSPKLCTTCHGTGLCTFCHGTGKK